MLARQSHLEGTIILVQKQIRSSDPKEPELIIVRQTQDLPPWLTRSMLERFLHDEMTPWEDTAPDIARALTYAFSDQPGKGGFVVLASAGEQLHGATVILDTGMSGYVPDHLLLFIAVREDQRGKGLGSRLIRKALSLCSGDVKLHVENDNPAKRLYERLGFENRYAEMRWRR
jgi:ribosomal-protein-alanine N-acetyltransferase